MDTGEKVHGHFSDLGGTLFGMFFEWTGWFICASHAFWISSAKDVFWACFTLARDGFGSISYFA
jgi:hypothetical protein